MKWSTRVQRSLSNLESDGQRPNVIPPYFTALGGRTDFA